jgi:hypothetical protein
MNVQFTDLFGRQATAINVKIGFKSLAGLGFMVGTEAYAQIGGNITIGGKASSADEIILTTRNTSGVRTSDLPGQIGAAADVFVGGAINFFYSIATTVDMAPTSCSVVAAKVLAYPMATTTFGSS